MGNCIYCGKPAGFLRKKHAECEEVAQKKTRIIEGAKIKIANEATKAIKNKTSLDDLETLIQEVEASSALSSSERAT